MLSAALAPLISDCLLHQIDEDFLAAYQASYGVAQPETTPTDHTQITATMETRSESISTALKEAKNSDKKVRVRVYSTVCSVHVHIDGLQVGVAHYVISLPEGKACDFRQPSGTIRLAFNAVTHLNSSC